MKLIHDVQEMQQTALALRRQGKRISFVPTMGFLHEGHASLLREGRRQGDVLVLSIFVNPTQFGPTEDLDRYPRNLAGDCALAEACGTDIVFAPTAAGMYPPGFQTTVSLGAHRPSWGQSAPGPFQRCGGGGDQALRHRSRISPCSVRRISSSWPSSGG